MAETVTQSRVHVGKLPREHTAFSLSFPLLSRSELRFPVVWGIPSPDLHAEFWEVTAQAFRIPGKEPAFREAREWVLLPTVNAFRVRL